VRNRSLTKKKDFRRRIDRLFSDGSVIDEAYADAGAAAGHGRIVFAIPIAAGHAPQNCQ
jgi:hypothetical protein